MWQFINNIIDELTEMKNFIISDTCVAKIILENSSLNTR